MILNVTKMLTTPNPVVALESSLTGTLRGVHFVKTPDYIQVTGVGNFTLINIPQGDSGGGLDNRGADGMLQLVLFHVVAVSANRKGQSE